MPATTVLPSLGEQIDRLLDLGVPELAGISKELRAVGPSDHDDALVVIHPDVAPVSRLVGLLEHAEKPGFVVVDMGDVDRFAPIPSVVVPDRPVYVIDGLDRGDSMANWSPDEALPAITAAGRTPLTLGEGVHWLLQRPDVLERNHCFMTIGSRLRKPSGSLDARTPAIWISNGTGRDGRENRNAPKVGWCWAGNRHTWLGFASAGSRSEPQP